MKLPTELLLLSLAILQPPTITAFPLHGRSLSFRSLLGLTPLTHDHSLYDHILHPTKFFHESTFSPHYDGRFSSGELPNHTKNFHLRLMLKAYMDTMQRIGIRTWLMHGCLLGWWWNGRIMPWDTDVDVMIDERSIQELGTWWNMSVHHFTARELGVILPLNHDPQQGSRKEDEDAEVGQRMLHEEVMRDGGKKYLLEVNPHYANISTKDKENVIDARWIDVSTGLFIDITTVHVQPITNPTAASAFHDTDEEDLELYTKDQHAYSYSQMFPLRTSTFEGVVVSIPFEYEELLLDEYGPRAITQRWYRGYEFDVEKHEWVAITPHMVEDGTFQQSAGEESNSKGGGNKMRTGLRSAAGRAYVQSPDDLAT
jgi:hypothetical protein